VGYFLDDGLHLMVYSRGLYEAFDLCQKLVGHTVSCS
jgi:hypothetical protein